MFDSSVGRLLVLDDVVVYAAAYMSKQPPQEGLYDSWRYQIAVWFENRHDRSSILELTTKVTCCTHRSS